MPVVSESGMARRAAVAAAQAIVAPPPASAAATGARRAIPPSHTAGSFPKTSFYQEKNNLSANRNPFILKIFWEF